jgi:hypothetical protein
VNTFKKKVLKAVDLPYFGITVQADNQIPVLWGGLLKGHPFLILGLNTTRTGSIAKWSTESFLRRVDSWCRICRVVPVFL